MTQSYSGVLNTFDVGGASQLEFFETANITISPVFVGGAPASRFGQNKQKTKLGGKISVGLWSDIATDQRVSHLQLSAATLGSLNLLSPDIIFSMHLGIRNTLKMQPGAGQLWSYATVMDGEFEGSLDLGMDSSVIPQPIIDSFSPTYADSHKVLAFTIGGTGVSVPFTQGELVLPIEKGGFMKYTMALQDRSARSGVTILPTGTTSLLQKAINDPKTAIAFAFQAYDGADSPAIAGDMVFESVGLDIIDGELVPIKYNFATSGVVTGVPGT